MKRYWDERAKLNAPWYVDTSLDYHQPDLDRFFETGRKIVGEAIDGCSGDLGSSVAVEIGCGLGRVTRALAGRFETVIGVDVSVEMLRRARDIASHPNVTFLLGDGSSLGQIRNGVADFVLSFTVFQHIPSAPVIERYIAEAGRILRSGGTFVFQWNNTPGSLRWMIRRVLLSTGERLGVSREAYGRNASEFLGSRVSMSRIRHALDRAGLKIERVRGEGTLYAWVWAKRP
jgi:SAM-dependent methyltransferase